MNETHVTTSPTQGGDISILDEQSLTRLLGNDRLGFIDALLKGLDGLGLMLSIKELPSGRYLHVNAAMAALLERSAADLVGRLDVDLLAQGPAAILRAADQTAMAAEALISSEHRLEIGGRKRDFNVMRMALRTVDTGLSGPGGGAQHLLSIWSEQTDALERESQLRQALEQLEQQQIASENQRREMQDSLRDSATGLYRQTHFEDQLRREVDLSSREHREFALVAISLDPLIEPIAALGEGARTRILEALGRLLRSNTRAMDVSCRLGPERFAILLSGVGLATAHSRMEGLRRQCATQIVMLEGRELGFTISMGVASFPHTAGTEAELVQAAEIALEEAGKRGGNHVALASIRFEVEAPARAE